MGHQHCRTSDNRTGKFQVCSGSSRILHKVDRGEASSQHSRSGAQKVLLAEHITSLRSATKDNSRQHQAVQLPYIQGFLPRDGGRSSFHLSLLPLIKRSHGKSKCTNILYNQNNS
jgi:hypothetical protein